jgi:hypothetical protein
MITKGKIEMKSKSTLIDMVMGSLVLILLLMTCLNYIKKDLQPQELTNSHIEAYIDANLDNMTFYPSTAVEILQRSLTAEGYECQVDGILGGETLTQYNRWKKQN